MSVELVTTTYGRSALDALRDIIRNAKRDDPMAPVTVVVPTNIAGIVARRHLASSGLCDDNPRAVAGIHVTTLPRLAEQLAAHRLHPRRPATQPVLGAAWRRQLATDPGLLEDVRDHPATVRALASAHRELRELSRDARGAAAKTSRLADDLIRLHEAVTDALSMKCYDETDLLHAATSLLDGDRSILKPFGHVVLYLPQVLRPSEARLAASVAAGTALTVVAGRTGNARADRGVIESLGRAGVDAPAGPAGPAGPAAPVASYVLHASDADDEVRCVVRRVVASLERHPAHRVAILYGSPVPYARTLHEQLGAIGVRVNGPSVRAVHERAIARAFLGILQLGLTDMPRAATFAALAEAPVSDLAGGRARVASWERVSRNATVVGGEDWDARLDHHVTRLREQIAELETSADPGPRIEAAQREVEVTRSLQQFAKALRTRLADGLSLRGWRALGEWARDLFRDLYGTGEDLRRIPAEEQYAAVVIESTVAGLSALADTDLEDADAPDLRLLVEVLGASLEAALPRVGRFGDGVFVGPVSAAVGLDLDEVFVLGLAEDTFPGAVREETLLPDRFREATGGELRTSRDRVDDQHRHLLAALQSAPVSTASFPRGNLRRSTERLPSRFLLATLRHITGNDRIAATEWDRDKYTTKPGERLVASDSFASSVTRADPVTEQEWRLRRQSAGVALADPAVDAAEELLQARASDDFTRFDGNLAHVTGLPTYADGVHAISPTALETYAACPHRFFAQRLLKVEPLETPEEIITVSPLEVGNLVHQVMDELITTADAEGTLPTYGQPWSQEHHRLLARIAGRLAEDYAARGVTGHRQLWRFELSRILSDLERMLDDDSDWRAQRSARVRSSELAFGLGGADDPGPVAVQVEGGRVLMRGSADKVDETADGTLLVTDIKTGRAQRFSALNDDPIAGGTKLQLPVYALAARRDVPGADPTKPAEAQYWFVRGEDRGKRLPVVLDAQTRDRYATAVGTLVTAIAAGLFPSKPSEKPAYGFVDCDYCTPDGLGHEEARDAYERKRRHPALTALMGLLDPAPED